MDRNTELKVVGYLIHCGLGNDTIAKFMSYLKNEVTSWRDLEYEEYTALLDELWLCETCGDVVHEDDAVDTFGTINGDYGAIVCPDCIEGGR